MTIRSLLSALLGGSSEPAIPPLGALPDTRSPEERAAQDIAFRETVSPASATTVSWKEIAKSQVRQFGVQDQGYKSDCVAETRRKLKRIMFKVNYGIDLDFSALAFYRKRSNYPGEGMLATNAIAIDRDEGMTLEQLVPSDPVRYEAQANAIQPEAFNEDVAAVFRSGGNDIVFDRGDLDSVAGTIQKTRKGVMVWFYFTSAEWSQELPTLRTALTSEFDSRALRHSVTAVEPALYRGQQGVWIEDSAHFGGLSRRFITRDFYERRNFWASYPMRFQFEPQAIVKPSFVDGDVVSLQDCLKAEGIFPTNIESTGFYGSLTSKAVRDFQAKYGFVVTGLISPETRAKLHELYP